MADEKFKSESYSALGGINVKSSQYVNNIQEFRDITNLNFFVPGALNKRPGTTLYVGATVLGRITGVYEFQRLSGASYIITTANTNAYKLTNTFTAFKAGLKDEALFDFETFVDRLFMGNGQDFFKYDGTNTTNYSLPPGTTPTLSAAAGSLTGTFLYGYGYLNDRGYLGPMINVNSIALSSQGANVGGLTTPLGFGITAIAIYRTSPGGSDLFRIGYAVAGATLFTDGGLPLTNDASNDNLYFTLAPRYIELYNNQLFLSGFSSMLSTVYWSNVGEPEGIKPEDFAEFRTNDGDRVTGMKAFQGALIISKQRSIHKLTGDNPQNFLIQEISDQYGCISNRCMITFQNQLFMLDTKGVVEYNGANISFASNRVESFFLNMNLNAAIDNACGIHYRQYNEIWFCIPSQNSTMNDTVMVYDYVAEAWTKYTGVNVSSITIAQGNLPLKSPMYGGYTGSVFYFGSSLFGDNGQAITCMIQTRFLAPMGQTVEEQFRRFYLNLNSIVGITQPITVNLIPNYGTSIAITRTMYQAPFQSRIDYGIPAKSLSAQVLHSSATLPFRIDGYTFESRFQRNV